jgi:hypothetical protein
MRFLDMIRAVRKLRKQFAALRWKRGGSGAAPKSFVKDVRQPTENTNKSVGILSMAATAFLWSIAGLFIKVIDWNPFAIAGMRSFIASIVICIYLIPLRLQDGTNPRPVGQTFGCRFICCHIFSSRQEPSVTIRRRFVFSVSACFRGSATRFPPYHSWTPGPHRTGQADFPYIRLLGALFSKPPLYDTGSGFCGFLV